MVCVNNDLAEPRCFKYPDTKTLFKIYYCIKIQNQLLVHFCLKDALFQIAVCKRLHQLTEYYATWWQL